MFNTCWACINETVLLQNILHLHNYQFPIKLCYIMYRRIIITSTLPFTSHCNYFRWTFKYFVFLYWCTLFFYLYKDFKTAALFFVDWVQNTETCPRVMYPKRQASAHALLSFVAAMTTSGWETDRGLTTCSLRTPRASLRNVKESNNNNKINVR